MPANARPDPSLAAALRRLREDRGLSQEEVAHRAGLHISSFREVELGNADPMWGTVLRIAAALGVSGGEVVLLAEGIAKGERA
jgi:transcriptional regulator with XRE-family HTH domain